MKSERHYYFHIVETQYEDGKWVSVVMAGENFFDIIDNMHF